MIRSIAAAFEDRVDDETSRPVHRLRGPHTSSTEEGSCDPHSVHPRAIRPGTPGLAEVAYNVNITHIATALIRTAKVHAVTVSMLRRRTPIGLSARRRMRAGGPRARGRRAAS